MSNGMQTKPEENVAPAAEAAQTTRIERWRPFFPWIVFGVALVLRLMAINWGLPNENRHWSYHPDEPLIYVASRQIEPAHFDFEPGFYNYGTLYLTALRIAGDIATTYAGGGEQPWMAMGATHLAGRLISAFAGAGTALFLFLMLRRRVGDVGALFGAAMVAFAPGHVIHSRFQTVDVLATFFLAASAYHALKLLPAPTALATEGKSALKAAIWSGVFAGLSAATKYTGILGLFTLVVAAILGNRKDAPKLSLAGIGSAIAVFLVTTPGVFLNSAKFLEDFRYEMQHTSQGHGLVFAGLPSGFVWHVYNLVVGVGGILVLMGLIGWVVGLWRRDPAAFALGAFALIYYILIGKAEVLFLRYTFPLLIVLAYGIANLIRLSAEKRSWAHIVHVSGILGLGGVFGGGFAAAATATMWMMGGDPRDQSAAMLRQEGGSVGLVSDPWFYTPTLYPEAGAPRWVPFEARDQAMRAVEKPAIERYVPPNPDERFDWDTRLLDERKPDFVVFSSFETEGLERLRHKNQLSELDKLLMERYKDFATKLQANYVLDKTYGGTGSQVHDIEYIRPYLWVWKRKP